MKKYKIGIIGSQKILHYQIAAYGSLASFARTLAIGSLYGLVHIVREKKCMDARFSDAACNSINFDAAIDENKYLAAAHYKPHDL